MANSIFRSRQPDSVELINTPEVKIPESKDLITTSIETGVEVPYTDYEQVNRKPYTVEHYQLGDRWEEGYAEEVATIEAYLKNKIDTGEIANSISAVKYELKNLEKINNLVHEERSVVKTGIIAAYVKFLMETDNIKYNVRKYR